MYGAALFNTLLLTAFALLLFLFLVYVYDIIQLLLCLYKYRRHSTYIYFIPFIPLQTRLFHELAIPQFLGSKAIQQGDLPPPPPAVPVGPRSSTSTAGATGLAEAHERSSFLTTHLEDRDGLRLSLATFQGDIPREAAQTDEAASEVGNGDHRGSWPLTTSGSATPHRGSGKEEGLTSPLSRWPASERPSDADNPWMALKGKKLVFGLELPLEFMPATLPESEGGGAAPMVPAKVASSNSATAEKRRRHPTVNLQLKHFRLGTVVPMPPFSLTSLAASQRQNFASVQYLYAQYYERLLEVAVAEQVALTQQSRPNRKSAKETKKLLAVLMSYVADASNRETTSMNGQKIAWVPVVGDCSGNGADDQDGGSRSRRRCRRGHRYQAKNVPADDQSISSCGSEINITMSDSRNARRRGNMSRPSLGGVAIGNDAVASLEALLERVRVAQALRPRYHSLLLGANFNAPRLLVRRGVNGPPLLPTVQTRSSYYKRTASTPLSPLSGAAGTVSPFSAGEPKSRDAAAFSCEASQLQIESRCATAPPSPLASCRFGDSTTVRVPEGPSVESTLSDALTKAPYTPVASVRAPSVLQPHHLSQLSRPPLVIDGSTNAATPVDMTNLYASSSANAAAMEFFRAIRHGGHQRTAERTGELVSSPPRTTSHMTHRGTATAVPSPASSQDGAVERESEQVAPSAARRPFGGGTAGQHGTQLDEVTIRPLSHDLRFAYLVGADTATMLRCMTVAATSTFGCGAVNFLCFFTSGDELRAQRRHLQQVDREHRRELELLEKKKAAMAADGFSLATPSDSRGVYASSSDQENFANQSPGEEGFSTHLIPSVTLRRGSSWRTIQGGATSSTHMLTSHTGSADPTLFSVTEGYGGEDALDRTELVTNESDDELSLLSPVHRSKYSVSTPRSTKGRPLSTRLRPSKFRSGRHSSDGANSPSSRIVIASRTGEGSPIEALANHKGSSTAGSAARLLSISDTHLDDLAATQRFTSGHSQNSSSHSLPTLLSTHRKVGSFASLHSFPSFPQCSSDAAGPTVIDGTQPSAVYGVGGRRQEDGEGNEDDVETGGSGGGNALQCSVETIPGVSLNSIHVELPPDATEGPATQVDRDVCLRLVLDDEKEEGDLGQEVQMTEVKPKLTSTNPPKATSSGGEKAPEEKGKLKISGSGSTAEGTSNEERVGKQLPEVHSPSVPLPQFDTVDPSVVLTYTAAVGITMPGQVYQLSATPRDAAVVKSEDRRSTPPSRATLPVQEGEASRKRRGRRGRVVKAAPSRVLEGQVEVADLALGVLHRLLSPFIEAPEGSDSDLSTTQDRSSDENLSTQTSSMESGRNRGHGGGHHYSSTSGKRHLNRETRSRTETGWREQGDETVSVMIGENRRPRKLHSPERVSRHREGRGSVKQRHRHSRSRRHRRQQRRRRRLRMKRHAALKKGVLPLSVGALFFSTAPSLPEYLLPSLPNWATGLEMANLPSNSTRGATSGSRGKIISEPPTSLRHAAGDEEMQISSPIDVGETTPLFSTTTTAPGMPRILVILIYTATARDMSQMLVAATQHTTPPTDEVGFIGRTGLSRVDPHGSPMLRLFGRPASSTYGGALTLSAGHLTAVSSGQSYDEMLLHATDSATFPFYQSDFSAFAESSGGSVLSALGGSIGDDMQINNDNGGGSASDGDNPPSSSGEAGLESVLPLRNQRVPPPLMLMTDTASDNGDGDVQQEERWHGRRSSLNNAEDALTRAPTSVFRDNDSAYADRQYRERVKEGVETAGRGADDAAPHPAVAERCVDDSMGILRSSLGGPDGVSVDLSLTHMRIGNDIYVVTEIVDRTFLQYREERVLQPTPRERMEEISRQTSSSKDGSVSDVDASANENSSDAQLNNTSFSGPFTTLEDALKAIQQRHEEAAQMRRMSRKRRAVSTMNFGDLSYSLAGSAPPRPGMRRQVVHMCWRCLSVEASIVFVPCGHYAVCRPCAEMLAECCICHTVVHSTISLIK